MKCQWCGEILEKDTIFEEQETCEDCFDNASIGKHKIGHGGRREGAGRKPSPWPTQLIEIKCSKKELAEILTLSTRERAEAMLHRTIATPQPEGGEGEKGER